MLKSIFSLIASSCEAIKKPFMRPIFHLALAHNLERQQRAQTMVSDPEKEERLFLHLDYNPVDPQSMKV
jgi:hypothetical protein